jgi:hypothetical protein
MRVPGRMPHSAPLVTAKAGYIPAFTDIPPPVLVCASPIKGVAIRITTLDSCGNSLSLTVSSHSFTQVVMTPQYEAGTEFYERTSDGQSPINIVSPPILVKLGLQVDLITIDPNMVTYVADMRALLNGTPATSGFASSQGPSVVRYQLESWQRVAGGCAVPTYVYHVWPYCHGAMIGTYSISNARSVLSFSSSTRSIYSVSDSTAGDHWRWIITTIAPPSSGLDCT